MKSLIIFLSMIFSSVGFAQSLQIEEVQLTGQGCPQGSVAVQISPDASSFTVLYDRLTLVAGADTTDASTECKVRIRLKKPLRMGFRIEEVDFRGYVYLDPGVVGAQKVRVTSGNGSDKHALAEFGYERWKGPINENFVLTALRSSEPPTTIDCKPMKEKSVIVLATKLHIKKAGGSKVGQITVDSADGRLSQKYRLRWTNCPNQLR